MGCYIVYIDVKHAIGESVYLYLLLSFRKVQARTAFAMYLVRVQQRLMTDCSSMSNDDVDGLNEQMVGDTMATMAVYVSRRTDKMHTG